MIGFVVAEDLLMMGIRVNVFVTLYHTDIEYLIELYVPQIYLPWLSFCYDVQLLTTWEAEIS